MRGAPGECSISKPLPAARTIRFLDHSFTYALIDINDPRATSEKTAESKNQGPFLQQTARVRRAVAMDRHRSDVSGKSSLLQESRHKPNSIQTQANAERPN